MPDVTVKLEGTPVVIRLGESTTLAAAYAAAASASAADAAASLASVAVTSGRNMEILNYPFQEAMNVRLAELGVSEIPLPDPATIPIRADDHLTFAQMHLSPSNEIYWLNGFNYADTTSFLTAAVGVESSGAYTFGPLLGTTNLITNGTFDTVTTGWVKSPDSGGVTLAIVSGELEATMPGGAGLQGARQDFAGLTSRAFQLTGSVRRGTTATAVAVRGGNNPGNISLNAFVASANSGTSFVEASLLVSANSGELYVGAATSGSSATGTFYMDNFSMVEAWPTPLFPQGDFSLVGRGYWTGALPGAATNLFRGHVDGTTDHVAVVLGTDGSITVEVKARNTIAGSTGASFVLGTIGADEDFAFAVNFGSLPDLVKGSLGGAAIVRDGTSGALIPGIAVIDTDASVTELAIVAGNQAEDWLQHQAAPTNGIVGMGDSYMAGAAGAGALRTEWTNATGRAAINIAVGGSTIIEQVALAKAKPYLRQRTFLMWDGGLTGLTQQQMMDAVAEFVAWLGHDRWVVIPTITPPPQVGVANPSDANFLVTEATKTALIALYGADHIYDSIPLLQTLGNGGTDDNADIAAGYPPRSLFALDGVHMLAATHLAVAADVEANVNAVETL